MTAAAPLALTLALSLAAAPGPLEELASLLGAGKCDDAFLLLSQVKAPSPASAANRDAARAVAQGAAGCRASDPMVALGFSSLAFRLAPDDLEVQLSQAEGLIAAGQRGEAAELLDRVVAASPADQAPGAWLMRGKLAAREAEHELAVRLLSPLAADPALKAEVGPLLAESELALREREQREQALATVEAQAAVRTQKAVEKADKQTGGSRGRSAGSDPEPDPDYSDYSDHDSDSDSEPAREDLVGTYRGSIGRHGSTSFTVSGLRVGGSYRFLANGNCRRTEASMAGVDFRVQFGKQPSRSLGVAEGRGLDRCKVPFVADASTMKVRVFDDSNTRENVRCVINDFSVEAE